MIQAPTWNIGIEWKEGFINRKASGLQQSGISNTLKWNLPVKEAAINFPAAALVALVAAVLRGEAQPALSVHRLWSGEPIEAKLHQCCQLSNFAAIFNVYSKPSGDFFQKSNEGQI